MKTDHLLEKMSKKSLKYSPRGILPGISTNVAAGPLGFRAELDIGHKGEQNRSYWDLGVGWTHSTVALDKDGGGSSRILFQGKPGEDEGLHAPETSTAGGMIDHGAEHRNDPTSECSLSLLSRPMVIRFLVFPHIRREHW